MVLHLSLLPIGTDDACHRCHGCHGERVCLTIRAWECDGCVTLVRKCNAGKAVEVGAGHRIPESCCGLKVVCAIKHLDAAAFPSRPL
jgi:hypothetical protein